MDKELTNISLITDLRSIIEQGKRQAYAAINATMISTYWNVGKRIVEEEQHGEARAEYGEYIAKTAAKELQKEYGNAFNYRNICYFRQFYLCFRNIEIVNARVHNLTWTHFRHLLRVDDEKYRPQGHNPTFGLILCADTDEDIARYSELNQNDHMFQAKYMLYMPSKEQLKLEIDREKEIFRLQNGGQKKIENK